MNEKFELTMNILRGVIPLTILATGTADDNPDGLNMTNSGKKLRWILKLGQVGDWCVYVFWENYSIDYVSKHGDKVMSKNNLKNIIEFNDDVWNKYRN